MASDHVSRLVFLFSCPQNPSINHLNFNCIKQIDYILPCVYCNRSQKMSQCVKNNSHHSISSRVVLFCSLHTDVICDLLQYIHTQKNVIYLLNSIWFSTVV